TVGAARYFGIDRREYYERAEPWPLQADGELLVVVMIESGDGVANIGRMLDDVPGIGAVFIGHGDLAESVGHPFDFDHHGVRAATTSVLAECVRTGVACGAVFAPDAVTTALDDGFRFVVVPPRLVFDGVEAGVRWREARAPSNPGAPPRV